MPSPKKKKPAASNNGERVVIHPKVKTVLKDASCPLTVAEAKEMLGWQEETEAVKFGQDYLLVDELGKKIRLANVPNNRPFEDRRARAIAKDVLAGHWELNLETIVADEYGDIPQGQHRLVGLVLAGQMQEKQPLRYPVPPTMEVLLAFGAKTSSKITRTYDNVRPRTIADSLYTSGLFASLNPEKRDEISKHTAGALKFVLYRTGDTEAYSPYQNSGTLEFLDRHPKIVECVKHILEENAGKAISNMVGNVGRAAGMLYLMGSSNSDTDAYHHLEPADRSEKALNWDNWDKACEFFVAIRDETGELALLRKTINQLLKERGEAGISPSERDALVAKAWLGWHQGDLSEDSFDLKYREVDGEQHLNEWPEFGGIDLGNPLSKGDEDAPPPEPTPEEVAAVAKAKAEIKAETLAKILPKPPVAAPEGVGHHRAAQPKAKVVARKPVGT